MERSQSRSELTWVHLGAPVGAGAVPGGGGFLQGLSRAGLRGHCVGLRGRIQQPLAGGTGWTTWSPGLYIYSA